MALYYLETSALVKLYIRETGTDRLLSLVTSPPRNIFALLPLARVELRSAILRRQREGQIKPKFVGLILDRFERHVRDNFFVQSLEEEVIETAVGLVDRHPLRAYDALHLAGCLVLAQNSGKNVPIFACADERLLHAARSEKIPVFDPRTN